MPLNPRAFGPRLPAALEQFGPAQAPGGLAGVGQGLPEAKDDTLTGLGRLPTFGMAESGGVLPDTATGGGGGGTPQALGGAPAGGAGGARGGGAGAGPPIPRPEGAGAPPRRPWRLPPPA